jgi:hypothetical protein
LPVQSMTGLAIIRFGPEQLRRDAGGLVLCYDGSARKKGEGCDKQYQFAIHAPTLFRPIR